MVGTSWLFSVWWDRWICRSKSKAGLCKSACMGGESVGGLFRHELEFPDGRTIAGLQHIEADMLGGDRLEADLGVHAEGASPVECFPFLADLGLQFEGLDAR